VVGQREIEYEHEYRFAEYEYEQSLGYDEDDPPKRMA
jgi:hypothetical protein